MEIGDRVIIEKKPPWRYEFGHSDDLRRCNVGTVEDIDNLHPKVEFEVKLDTQPDWEVPYSFSKDEVREYKNLLPEEVK